MKIIDEITAKLSDMSRDVASIPVVEQLHAAGVKLPASGRFHDLDELDMALIAAFPDTHLDKNKSLLARRMALKNQILNAGMCGQTDRPMKDADEATAAAVKYAAVLLKKHGVKMPADGKMFLPGDISAMSISLEDRLHLKVSLEKAGLMDMSNTVVSKPIVAKPPAAMVKLIFAELELKPVDKIHVNELSRIMTERDVGPRRRIQIKETLSAAGILAE
jgi:hypothetical protein